MNKFITRLKNINIERPPLHKILLGLTLVYFITFSILMVHTNGQPDQAPHGYYARKFSETWTIPDDDPNVRYIIEGNPYLYYWLGGVFYKIVQFLVPAQLSVSYVLIWRLFSTLLSSFSVFFMYKLGSKVTGNKYGGILAAFFLSNTLMFVFVSGGISYDNLMNLASLAAVYHLVCLYKKEDFIKNSALTGSWVIVGALAKEQFLLMTLIIFLAWLFFVIRNYKSIRLDFSKRNLILLGLFLIGLVFLILLYVPNFVKYSNTTPDCGNVKPPEICSGAYANLRESYEPMNISFLWFQRDNYNNPIHYALSYWIVAMMRSVWGILSHNTFVPFLAVSLHGVLTLWGLICLVRYWKIDDTVATVLVFILLSYVGYIFFWNYKTEVEHQFLHFGVTGRYLMPAIGVLYSIMVHYFLKIKSLLLKRLTISLSIILYFSGGLWMFISRYNEIFIHWRIFY